MSQRLIELDRKGKIVFVGDTHGDLEASTKIITRYLKPDHKIVFLGDYVDRGNDSVGNIKFLLKVKKKNPTDVYLLAGNHEGYSIQEFYPSDFWHSIGKEEKDRYSILFREFPIVVSVGNIIALHGALPNIEKLNDINSIIDGNDNWQRILWGDFFDSPSKHLRDRYSLRPQFGKDYFNEIMERLNKRILVRSHQPDAPELMYDKRCLTIFTSLAYGGKRTVAIVDLDKNINTIDDLIIKEI